MAESSAIKTNTHVVDILGNVKGRDQPIMLMEKAVQLVLTLGEDDLLSDDIVFFDPFCKAGEIMLACALSRCSKTSRRRGLVDLDFVKTELYESKRYYALAPDERHHRLSLRTFLGNEHSHNKDFQKIIKNGNYLSELDGRLNLEKYQKELDTMIQYIKEESKNKRIIAVGNPPYQESDSGFGGSAKSIYNVFAESLMDCDEISEFALVIPSRWFTTGKGTSSFRQRILNSKTIKTIQHFKHSKMVFPTVDVLGGICFIHYDANYNGDVNFIEGPNKSTVDISRYDIILDDPKGYNIVDKVVKKWSGDYVSEIAWSVRPFAIRTFYFQRNESLSPSNRKAVPCFSKRRQIKYANIDDIPKNTDKINEWKVAVPRAYAPGSKMGVRRVTLPVDQYFIIPKGHITTETYNVVGSFKTKKEAENFLKYLTTDFGRYLLGLRKVTQDIYQKQWSWIPLLDLKTEWTDEKLFKKFEISKEEQAHIRVKIKEWS